MPIKNFIPRPRLVLNIGITGHRLNKFDTRSIASVSEQFRQFAEIIDAALAAILAEGSLLFQDQQPLVRVVTALAEGADRIALSCAPPAWVYEAVLPMLRDEYAKDFGAGADTGSRDEFDSLLASSRTVTELPSPEEVDDPHQRNACYRRVGDFLIRQVDLLVAVWDGAPPKGPGGTGDVVARAVASGRPVCWIDVTSAAQPRLLVALDASGVSHDTAPLDAQSLLHLLHRLLMPDLAAYVVPDGSGHATGHRPQADGTGSGIVVPAYLETPWPNRLYLPFAYMTLRRLSNAGRWSWPLRYPGFLEQRGNWDPFFSAMPQGSSSLLSKSLTNTLFPRSIWSDTLAWYFGNVYRSAYVSSFFLASLSVPLGLCYLFFLWSETVLNIKAGFVVAELLIITTVIVVVRRGARSNWHELWLQTRELSELLRLGRPLAYIGGLRDFVPAPAASVPISFASWYARATFREVALPNAVLGSIYLKTVLCGTRDTEIREQRAYHASNAVNLERIHHVLHKSGDLCFAATIVFLLIYLAAWALDWATLISHADAAGHEARTHSLFHEILEYGIKPIVSIAAAGLPALGAALTGIREQGDFEGFAERSCSTNKELADCEVHIDRLVRAAAVDIDQATEALTQATLVMAKDVTAWKQQYSGKRLALPA